MSDEAPKDPDIPGEDNISGKVTPRLGVENTYRLLGYVLIFFSGGAMLWDVWLINDDWRDGSAGHDIDKLGVIPWLFSDFGGPLLIFGIAFVMAMIGMGMLSAARNTISDTIPAKDRTLLEPLIQGGKSEEIGLYIRLSSLKGLTGLFTHLGISGLPLATIGLTLVFCLGAIAVRKDDGDLNPQFIDLAKLTLGAFIGSFVQRSVTGKTVEEDKIETLTKSIKRQLTNQSNGS